MQRVELHLHTDYSILDGLGKINRYVPEAKRMGMTALGIMDHGSLAGVYDFYSECRKHEIAPVIASEFYFVNDAALAREFKDSQRYHIGIIAKGARGYRVLKELNNAAHANYYYKPLLDRRILEGLGKDAKHLVCLSGCMGSIISQKLLSRESDYLDEIKWWQKIFPYFFLESQWHGIAKDDKRLNQGLIKVQRRLEISHVITNDCHYVKEGDCSNHDALLAIQTQSQIDDPDRFRFLGDGYHLASAKEIGGRFRRAGFETAWISEGFRNSLSIARNCRADIPEWNTRTWHIPPYPNCNEPDRLLEKLVRNALRKNGKNHSSQHTQRAREELAKIQQVGISNFILIARHIVRWAQSNGIPTGPGRGSVAGCYVAYLIGITEVDSVKYKLRFERFLNPERPKMPDVDFDFTPKGRVLVKAHSADLYGAENILPVGAFQTLKTAGAFRKLASAHGIEWSEINRLSKLLNPIAEEGDDDDEDMAVIPKELREGYPELATEIAGLVGTRSANSSHPSGVMIFDAKDPIKDLVPTIWLPPKNGRAGMNISAFDLHSSEKMGLMKMDYLGLRTLETIEVCLDILRNQYNVDLEPREWIPDEEEEDDQVYKMLARGKTAGVFQMEGKACTRGIQEVACSDFEDIAATTALYRLGPIMAGADKRYVKNKAAGIASVPHPSLKDILANTWGEMIYQEQMMDICHEVAGFTWIETDDVKETVRFKDPERMAAFSNQFITGCKTTSGIEKETATQIWKMIEAQSAYLFNRSHAIAYSLITYRTARLKYLYPLQYSTAYLATVEADNDVHKRNRKQVLSECHERGFKILPPEVNMSGVHMTCEKLRTMRFGFQDIKGIGESSATKLVTARKKNNGTFTNLEEVIAATNKKTRDSLAGCGALSWIGGPKVKRAHIEEYVDWIFDDPMGSLREQLEGQVYFPIEEKDWAMVAGVLISNTPKTTKAGKPYHVWSVRWSPSQTFVCQLWSETETWWTTPLNSIVAIEGEWSAKYKNISVGDSGQIKLLRRAKNVTTTN